MVKKAFEVCKLPEATCIPCHMAGDNEPKEVTCFVKEDTGTLVWRYCTQHLKEAQDNQEFKLSCYDNIS